MDQTHTSTSSSINCIQVIVLYASKDKASLTPLNHFLEQQQQHTYFNENNTQNVFFNAQNALFF